MMNRNKLGFFLSVIFLIIGIFNASAATVMLDFPEDLSKGQIFDINVIIDPKGEHVAGVQLDLEFNKSSVFVNSITEGNFLKQSGINTYFNRGTINNTIGKVVNINGAILGRGNVTTPGAFIIINARSIGMTNAADINFTNILVVDPEGKPIYPMPTPNQNVKTEALSSASGDVQGGGGRGTSIESLQEPASSNHTLLALAFVGIIIISIFVYKYKVVKQSGKGNYQGKETDD
jgi:hypothetical protein